MNSADLRQDDVSDHLTGAAVDGAEEVDFVHLGGEQETFVINGRLPNVPDNSRTAFWRMSE